MARILEALQQKGFECHAPRNADPIPPVESSTDGRLGYRPFEEPRPGTEQVAVEESRSTPSPLFRYFVDGSARTTNAGYIIDSQKRYLPIYIAQIAVAATRLEKIALKIESYRNRNIFFFPNTFSKPDFGDAKHVVRGAAQSSRWPLDLELSCYEVMPDTDPLDAARKKVLEMMHAMEIKLIKHLANSEKLTRDHMLMIDGSLQFYQNLNTAREAFRNVVGVAKSFDLNQRIGSGLKGKQVGALIAELKHQHRTPAHKVSVPRVNHAIGAWYLRLHPASRMAGLGVDDGVIKLELFPDDGASGQQPLSTDRCDMISRHVLALRYPTTPSVDKRWASHLYPIHLTERYIKTRFRDERAIRAHL